MNFPVLSISTHWIKTQAGCLVFLILFPLLIYFNALKGPFQFDDQHILEQKWVENLEEFNNYVHLDSFQNRPVLLLTYAANNSLKKYQVFGFHLGNLLIHILVSILVFHILVRSKHLMVQKGFDPAKSTENKPLVDSPKNQFFFPFVSAILFAVHPLNTETVSYISSRSTLLATFFYLSTLFIFLELLFLQRGPHRKFFGVLLALILLAVAYLSIASKLIAATLPVMGLIWFLILISPSLYPGFSSWLFNRKMTPVYLVAASVLAGVVILAAELHFYSPRDQGTELFGSIPYLLVQAKVIIFHYLRLFLFPINLNVDTGFPFGSILSDFTIPISLLIILIVLFLAFRFGGAWIKIGAAWFFITLLPTSSIIPLNDLAVEHRTYLPLSLGLCLIIGWFLTKIQSLRISRGLIILLIGLSILTISRNRVWSDEISLWADSVKKNPHSPRGHTNLGKAYYEKGNLNLALSHFQKSIELIPSFISHQYNLDDPKEFLSRVQQKKRSLSSLNNKTSDLKKFSNQHLKINADLVEPHYNLASVHLDLGNLKEAEREYQTAINLKPDHFASHLGLGSVYKFQGNISQAIITYEKAIKAKKKATGAEDYPLARLNLGELYGISGDYPKAVRELKRAIRLDPNMKLGHYNLGTAYMMQGALLKAEKSLNDCLRLDGNFEPAHYNLAKVLQKMGKWRTSNNQFEKFLKITGPKGSVYFEIARNHREMGEIKTAVKYLNEALKLNPPHDRKKMITQLIGELSAS